MRETTVPCILGATESDDTRPHFAVRHYTVAEIAQMWHLSADAVRKIFEGEPGVLSIGESRSTGRKRRYVTLRIPEDVAERVHRRLQYGSLSH